MTSNILLPLKRTVILAPVIETQERSRQQLKMYHELACADSIQLHESPLGTMLLSDLLDHDDPREMALITSAIWTWISVCDTVAVYCDLGISQDMTDTIAYANAIGKDVERRTLDSMILRDILNQ
jgi:hypothetical protein